MDLTVSSESSGALPDSPVRENPVPIEEQLEIIPACPKQPISIQTEAHKQPERTQPISNQTMTHKLPEPPLMELSTKVNEPEQQSGISPAKESQHKPQGAIPAPKNLSQVAEETKSNVSKSSRSSGSMKRQPRLYGSPLCHAINAVDRQRRVPRESQL